MVAMDREVAIDFYTAYTQLVFSQHFDNTNALAAFSEASRKLVQYPELYEATRAIIAPVSFGKPLVYTDQEKSLQIPNSIDRQYDVYWIEFAISLRNLQGEDFDQATFHVMIPDDSIALELIPLSHGIEQTVTDKAATPTIGVARGGVEVKLGEFFSHTVAYTTLKPVIIANGLQESQFSWNLKGEAVNSGSKRFVAILGVPKGSVSLVTQLALAAKTNDTWGIQGDIASTGVIVYKIEL